SAIDRHGTFMRAENYIKSAWIIKMPRDGKNAKRSVPKKPQTKTRANQRHESDDFESVARRLECDEDKEQFETKLGKIAKAKPHS
ncbi:MAG: hypothetical protein WBZ39_08320, partial [Methylovirgula sp.]